jgi:predicted  nucleic acid-binding Zn-ribbon protein
MLWFALSAHFGTALVAAAIAFFSGKEVGYYIAGIAMLSTAFRPAAAYFGHVRERVKVLTRESTHPRDDVATLLQRADVIEQSVSELRVQLTKANEDLRRTESALADGIAHARQVLTADLNRLQDAQVADRAAARSRDDDLERRIDQMVRRIEATLDGISDHQELLTGLRALVRMVRSDPA